MLDVKQLAEQVFVSVKTYLDSVLTPVREKLAALEQRATVPGKDGIDGKDGRDGIDGKSVSAEEVLPVIKQLVGELPLPKDGIDGKDGAPGKDGKDGVDGKSVTLDEVLPTLKQWFDAVPLPKNGLDGKDGTDGKDGRAGVDGKSITLDDIRPLFDKALAEWQLDFERRGMDMIQRHLDRIEKPKDGKDGIDGKPGRDAFDLKDFDATLQDDERTLVLSFTRGDDRIERSILLAHPIYRGVWREGAFLKGDCVTFGGSTWIATRDTEAKPEQDDSWRLSVKRGRDGRDGEKGEQGEKGDPGKLVRT